MVRFFDRFKTNERNPEATKTGWETLAIPTVEEKKVVENPRQQRKIAYCLTTGDYSAIDKHDVDTPVSEDEFLQRLGAGEITKTDERQMLIQIATPAYGGKYQAVVDKIRQNKHHSRILGNFSGVGFDNYANVDDTAVKNFLTQYPTPIDFDEAEQDFLKSIRDYNDEEKYQEYQRDMASFKKQIYGKRQEYWEQMQILEKKAKERSENGFEMISEEEGLEILKKTKIDGDAYVDNYGEHKLRVEALQKHNLAPQYKVKIDGQEIDLSSAYKVGRRNAVMAYAKTEEGYEARSYYQSNSSGLWRYLQDYVGNTRNILEWYGKGLSEESLTLPFAMQKQLERIRRNGVMHIKDVPGKFFLTGTAKRYNSQSEYVKHLRSKTLRGKLYQEIEPSATVNFGELSWTKSDPTSLDIDGEKAPDFTKKVDSFALDAGNSGESTADIYPSCDGQLNYMFLTDGRGRSYLGGIEAKSKITSCGVREKWVSGGDFATPLYEYEVQADGYGDSTDTQGDYTCMWEKYLSKMPIIRRYQAAKSRESW